MLVTPLSDGFRTIRDQFRPFINEARIELNNRSSGFHFLYSVLSAHDAAGSDDRKRTLEMLGGNSGDFRRTCHQGFAGKAAGFLCQGIVFNRLSGNRRVGADHTIHAVLNNDVERVLNAVVR
mgnify:CR=1 FL=1